MELKIPRKGLPMTDYCAFSKDHKCIKWTDYELLRHELEEADELCHNNWTEIQHLREYIGQLQALLLRISEKNAHSDRNTQVRQLLCPVAVPAGRLPSQYTSFHQESVPQA